MRTISALPSDITNAIHDSSTMETSLLELCEQLKTIMAANWVIRESSTGAKYFSEGYEIKDRKDIIRQTAQRLNWDLVFAEQKITEKEAIIQSKLSKLDEAYTVIDGKHLIHQIMYKYIKERKSKARIKHFRNLLTRAVKEKIGLHADILLIIKQRILSNIT